MWRRIPLGALAGTAVVSGYLGLWQYVHSARGSGYGQAWWDVLYYDLQLFALGSRPLEGPTPFNPALEVGRYLAAATTAYALLLAASALFGHAWRRWRRRRTKGHAIVVGATPAARAIAERRARTMTVLQVPSTDPALLRAAGLSRARVVYACGADNEDAVANLATALAAASRRRTNGLRINVQVTDPTLALGLKARRLMRNEHHGPVIDFFSMEEMAARRYVESDPFDEPVRPRILVAGAGAFGQAVIVEFARQWRLRSPRSTQRVAVTLVDERAAEAAELLVDRWPVVRDVCDITAVSGRRLPAGSSDEIDPYYRAFFCQDDEHLALSSALSAVSVWRAGPRSVVVRLNQLARHEAVFNGDGGLLDNLGGRISVVSVADAAGDLVVQDREPVRELAEAVHLRYMSEVLATANLARSVHENYRATARHGGPATDNPAMRPWDQLGEEYRTANHAQAQDFTNKLRRIGCTIAPRSARIAPVQLSEDEMETLSVHEHDRWIADRTQRGWRYGPQRDDSKKLHPDLVPWDRLPEPSKEKDRDAVRNLSAVYDTALAEVGLQIVRLDW